MNLTEEKKRRNRQEKAKKGKDRGRGQLESWGHEEAHSKMKKGFSHNLGVFFLISPPCCFKISYFNEIYSFFLFQNNAILRLPLPLSRK